MKNKKGEVLYIGKAKILQDRIRQYLTQQDSRAMIPLLVSQIDSIETLVTFTEKEALLLENDLIKTYQPKYNILLKDDKTFISLVINHKHTWPMVQLVHHKKQKNGDDDLRFGPYPNAFKAYQLLHILTKLFPLRQCSDREFALRKRPCILYAMKRCLAPCVQKCSKEVYDKTLQEAILFLRGKRAKVLKNLKESMEKASELREFEKANHFLHIIRQIEEKDASFVAFNQLQEVDAIHFIRKEHNILFIRLFVREGKLLRSDHFHFTLSMENNEELLSSFLLQYYTKHLPPKQILLPFEIPNQHTLQQILQTQLLFPKKGNKKALIRLAFENVKALYEQQRTAQPSQEALLLSLQETLQLNNLPFHIECIDISHISGFSTVGSLAAFTNGMKDGKKSRLYKINHPNGDDYAALKEVLTRRLTNTLHKKEDLPDLMILDGGKGQLNTALKLFKQLGIISIDLISLTKEASKHTKGLTKEKIFLPHTNAPIFLDPHSSIHFFLQTIRDEAHRKAISYHRKRQTLTSLKSKLDDIPGIGPIKKQKLFSHFGSIKHMQKASLQELSKIVSKKDAETITYFLNH